MKKLLLLLISVIVITLAACVPDTGEEGFDYSDFASFKVESHDEAENIGPNKYILYYYSELCSHCQDVKQDILSFFNEYETLPFYLVDTGEISDSSSYDDFYGTPTVFVISNNEVSESYVGSTEIRGFISQYADIELDYSTFDSQHLTNYQDVLDIENDAYILYYYLDSCPHCNFVKEDMLEWAYTKSFEDVYFMNGANVTDPDNIPTELTILSSGTPLIIVMSNGEFADEYYSGSEDVLAYIIEVGENDIEAPNYVADSNDVEPVVVDCDVTPDHEDCAEPVDPVVTYDYDDFSDETITKFIHSLTISNNVHLSYYYSPLCSHCNSIKQDVLTFFSELEDLEFYLLDVYAASDDNVIGLTGVPAIYLIVGNEVEIRYSGTSEILNFIQQYTEGTINFDDY